MQHTLTPFLIRALSKTEEEKRTGKTETDRGRVKEGGKTRNGGRGRNMRAKEGAESVTLISWQFGTSPDLPGKATDVSEPVRHGKREGTRIHTQLSHMHVHTAHMQTTCVYTRTHTHGNAQK